MEYVPNLIARGLRTSPKIIGVITQDMRNPYYIDALYEIEKLSKAKGYALLHMNSDNDPEIESSNIYQLLSMKVQGIILIASMLDDTDRMIKLAKSDTGLVTMESRIEGLNSVVSDPQKGISQMVRVFVERGHQDFGLVHHSMRSYPIKEREKVFLSELQKHGIMVSDRAFFYGDNYLEQLDVALDKKALPSAIFALNDNTAFEVYGWCRRRSLEIPKDLSVVGFDDISANRMMMPPLSTVRQPIGLLAQKTTEMLIDGIKNKTAHEAITVKVETEFIDRKSVDKPKTI